MPFTMRQSSLKKLSGGDFSNLGGFVLKLKSIPKGETFGGQNDRGLSIDVGTENIRLLTSGYYDNRAMKLHTMDGVECCSCGAGAGAGAQSNFEKMSFVALNESYVASGGEDGNVRVFVVDQFGTFEGVGIWPLHACEISAVAVCVGLGICVSGDVNGEVCLSSLANGGVVKRLKFSGEKGGVKKLAIGVGNGLVCVVVGGGGVKMVSVSGGEVIASMEQGEEGGGDDNDEVNVVEFGNDGKFVVIGGAGGSLKI